MSLPSILNKHTNKRMNKWTSQQTIQVAPSCACRHCWQLQWLSVCCLTLALTWIRPIPQSKRSASWSAQTLCCCHSSRSKQDCSFVMTVVLVSHVAWQSTCLVQGLFVCDKLYHDDSLSAAWMSIAAGWAAVQCLFVPLPYNTVQSWFLGTKLLLHACTSYKELHMCLLSSAGTLSRGCFCLQAVWSVAGRVQQPKGGYSSTEVWHQIPKAICHSVQNSL